MPRGPVSTCAFFSEVQTSDDIRSSPGALDARRAPLIAFESASRAAFPSLSRKGAVPMTLRPTFRAMAFGLSLVSVVPAALQAAQEKPAPPRPKARVYTNEDLDRVH